MPELPVVVREGGECVCDFLNHLSGEEIARSCQILWGDADVDDSFVSIMSGITAVGNDESEGWTFADALSRANLPAETLAEGVVDTSFLPTS